MARQTRKKTKKEESSIVIDKEKGLVFESEDEVYDHFSEEIKALEQEFDKNAPDEDIEDEEVGDFEARLAQLFESPDEVWKEAGRFQDIELYTYIKKFEEGFYYVAVTYVDDNLPSFIFLHFATRNEDFVNGYRRTQKVFSHEQSVGSGDALSEGDEFAMGLYKAMLTVRAENDIPTNEFGDYLQFRDETVEEADEIWRNSDLSGNVLVTFIKHFNHDEEDENSHDEDFSYVTITIEDSTSESHYVLFSFPTRDKSLLERYRHGESIHTDEVVQEESH